MRVLKSLPPAITEHAAAHHGAVPVALLWSAGLTGSGQQRQIAAGALQRDIYGAVVVAGFRDRFSHLAAIQQVRPDVVAEGMTAGAVWDLDGLRDHLEPLTLVSPTRVRRQDLRPVRHGELFPGDITLRNGLLVTTPIATLRQLAYEADVDTLELALECALHRQLVTEAQLREVASGNLAEALDRRRPGEPPTQSYAETRFLQRVVRYLTLRPPERQVPISVRGRRQPYHGDFVFRSAAADHGDVDVEIDGLEFHGTPKAHNDDLLRDERIRATGITVVRFAGWRMDGDRHGVCRTLLKAAPGAPLVLPSPA